MMTLRWIRAKNRSIGRGMLAMAMLLWGIGAVAPCVMAYSVPMDHTHTHSPKNQGMDPSAMIDCGPVTAINCQLPDVNTPIAATIGDLSVTPALLTTLPAPLRIISNTYHTGLSFHVPDIFAPPLHIRHLTLLI